MATNTAIVVSIKSEGMAAKIRPQPTPGNSRGQLPVGWNDSNVNVNVVISITV